MRRGTGLVAAAVLLLFAGCGHDTKRDAVADAGASLSRVQRGTLHLKLDLGADTNDPSAQVGFQMDGVFDLAPPGAPLPAADLTTANLGSPEEPPVHFVSTAHDAFIVQDGVGYQLTPQQVAPLRLDASTGTGGGITGLDLRGWVIDPVAQPTTTTPAGENVDRITGRADPIAALNGIVDLAGQLGGAPDPALHVSATDADAVRSAMQSSSFEVLMGRDDRLLRGLTVQVQFAAPAAARPSTGGAVAQAIDKLGHLTLTIELRLDRPNSPVDVPAPAQIRPISELRRG